jgi:hypothetical protein
MSILVEAASAVITEEPHPITCVENHQCRSFTMPPSVRVVRITGEVDPESDAHSGRRGWSGFVGWLLVDNQCGAEPTDEEILLALEFAVPIRHCPFCGDALAIHSQEQ